jgi:hypothetical protein
MGKGQLFCLGARPARRDRCRTRSTVDHGFLAFFEEFDDEENEVRIGPLARPCSALGKEIRFEGGVIPVGGRFTDIRMAFSDDPPGFAGIDSTFAGTLAVP